MLLIDAAELVQQVVQAGVGRVVLVDARLRKAFLQRNQLGQLGVKLALQIEREPDPGLVVGQTAAVLDQAAAVLRQLGLEPVERVLQAGDQAERGQLG